MKPIPKYIALLIVVILFYACASTGWSPDGGPYDETPPKFVRANPVPNATNNTRKNVSIEFDEYINLENASEKVIISPPQREQPEVKTRGKRVVVEFLDSLIANTTYTIDFGDAIVDNNEGNPLGQFSYAFSTGPEIDTMAVSGTVLNAENLEPIKGIQVGLHKNLNDTAFTKLPFDRISRTDSRGQFTIRGVAPGKYRIYALQDGNQNYMYDSKTETVAWTVWNEIDTTHIDTIFEVHYTRFLPDNVMLRAFKEESTMQYLAKSERPEIKKFNLYFSAKADTLPTLRGLDFDEKQLIVEANQRNDSITYWVKDTTLCERDTLTIELKYLETDTLGQLVPTTDTLRMINKIPRERRLAMKKEADEKAEKERKKKEKKGDTIVVETKFLTMNVDAPSELDINRNIIINFDEPIESIDTPSRYDSAAQVCYPR